MRILLTAIILLVFKNIYAQPRYIDPSNLTWRDYSGQIMYDSGFTAFTKCDVSIKVVIKNVKIPYGVLSIKFLPESSWVNWQTLKGTPNNSVDSLFRHELLHYYIGIITFKKAKLALSRHKIKSLDDVVVSFRPFADFQKDQNDAYDKETDHSRNKSMQIKWDKSIMEMYNALNNVVVDKKGEWLFYFKK